MKKRFTEEQIVAILREGQSGQKTIEQLCKEQNIATATYYGWKRKYGAMSEPDVKLSWSPKMSPFGRLG